MSVPLLYTAELDLHEANFDAFLEWYAFRHAPDVYQVGFSTCTCYRVIGGDMNFLDLYELPSWDLFETAAYRGMRARDPYMDSLMAKRWNKAHSTYDQLVIAPVAEGPCLDADWISVLLFAVDEEADEAIAVALARHQPLKAIGGMTRVRYAVRGKDHPTNPTFRPRCMVVAEWDQSPPADAGGIPGLLFEVAGAVEEDTLVVGERVYPWRSRVG
jgi:hypothetical protein